MRNLRRIKITRALLLVLLLSALTAALTACHSTGGPSAGGSSARTFYSLTREDSRTQPDSPKNYALEEVGSELLITEGGDYVLSGKMYGCVHVRAEDQLVHLFLNGVRIKSYQGPAIYAESAGKVIVTVCDGTVNELSDGGSHTGESDAALFSMNDLTINGGGSLSVSGLYKDAIHTKDFLKITGTQMTLRAKGDGLHGNDAVFIKDAVLDIQAEANGIQTTQAVKAKKGNVEIVNSKVTIIAGIDGIYAERNIYITNSTVSAKGVLFDMLAEDGTIDIEEGSGQ